MESPNLSKEFAVEGDFARRRKGTLGYRFSMSATNAKFFYVLFVLDPACVWIVKFSHFEEHFCVLQKEKTRKYK